MLIRHCTKYLARFTKPKLSKYKDVFEIMAQRDQSVSAIEQINRKVLANNKFKAFSQKISQDYRVTPKTSQQISKKVLKLQAFSSIHMKQHYFHQNFNGDLQPFDMSPQEIEIPYSDSNNHLKFHYSILKGKPIIPDYKVDEKTAIIFNIPEQVTQRQIMLELGIRYVKSVQIKYCVLGLPAYAIVEFNSQHYLSDLILSEKQEILLKERISPIVTYPQKENLSIQKRQLVLKELNSDEKPSRILNLLSMFGRVLHFDMPSEIYRQPSEKQIKQLYKNQQYPVKINVYKANGKIQSQYYPPFSTKGQDYDSTTRISQQYKRRLRFSENIDIYEGEEGKIKAKSKGYCFVTFSSLEQAQNCYFHLRNFYKIDLVNKKSQFLFDTKHKQALLRFIDNTFITQKLKNYNDYNSQATEEKKFRLDNSILKKFFMDEIIYQNYYQNSEGQEVKQDFIAKNFQEYRKRVDQIVREIGKGHLSSSNNNKYGKSFDQLAEEQLYGKKRPKKDAQFQIKLSGYDQKPQDLPVCHPLNEGTKGEINMKNITQKYEQFVNGEKIQIFNDEDQNKRNFNNQILRTQEGQREQEEESVEEDEGEVQGQGEVEIEGDTKNKSFKKQFVGDFQYLYKQRNFFSTYKEIESQFVGKTPSQILNTHFKYNQFIKNTINEYMGVFSDQKLQQQLDKKKPSFLNPQKLKFIDGSDFIKEEDLKKILERSPSASEETYHHFLKDNEVFKSLNYDLQESVLKDFQNNYTKLLHFTTDFGVVKESYEYNGENIEDKVKQLNRLQAQFGQQYRISQGKDVKPSIVKIAKTDHIFPLKAFNKLQKIYQQQTSQESFEPSKIQLVSKYQSVIENQQPLPEELAKQFGLQAGKVYPIEELMMGLSEKYDFNLKDIECFMNAQNYDSSVIQQSVKEQIHLEKQRQKLQPSKASDYGKSTSEMGVKDKDGKYKVSRFRQI